MKFFISLIFGLGLLFFIPFEAESQSRSPVQDRRPSVRPPSNSRPPGGTGRPLRQSRRSQALGQYGWEVGGNIGTSLSLTEVSGTSVDQKPSFLNSQWNATRLNIGGFGRYRFNNILAVRGSVNYGRMSGADSLASGRERNFAFTNNIFELGVVGEVYAPKSSSSFPLDFYGFLGFAGFYHNPQLQVPEPIPNDFTLDSYSNIQAAIPVGIGINYMLANGIKVGYEIGYRKLFTDYLDGFTRPYSQGNDAYYFTSVKITYPLQNTGSRVRF